MYNFKKNAKLYIVELNANGSAFRQHSIEIYSDITASQTLDEQSSPTKTLHNQTYLHDYAVVNGANAANFSFTTPLLNITTVPIVLTLGREYSTGTVTNFDIYIQSDNVIYKITKCVIDAIAFNLDMKSVITMSVSGTASKIQKYGNVGSVTIPTGSSGIFTPTYGKGSKYATIDAMKVTIGTTVLDSVASINMDLKNDIKWYDETTLQESLAAVTIRYYTAYVLQKRTLSGSITQFITSDNIDTLTDSSMSSAVNIQIYEKSYSSATPILEFNLPSTVFTRRLNFEELINRVYDFRLNTNTNTSTDISYKTEPTIKLDFTSGTLDSRVSLTRTTTATRVNSSGLIETVAINTPRFEYNPVTLELKGLLVEGQRVNLMFPSSATTGWTASPSGSVAITANAATSPDGTTNATKLATNDTASNGHVWYKTYTGAINTAYCGSAYFKAGEYTRVQMAFDNSSFATATGALFDLTGTGTVVATGAGSTAIITAVGNGWYRCSITATSVGTVGNYVVSLTPVPSSVTTFNAVYVPASTGLGIYVYGVQVEANAFATSYIPTTTAQVTRAGDITTMTGTNFSSWYNQTQGTFIMGARVNSTTATRVWMDVGPNGAFGTTAYIAQNPTSISLNPGAAPVNMNSQVSATGLSNTAGIAIQDNNSIIAVNGNLGTLDTICTVPAAATMLAIGSPIWNLGGSVSIEGCIRYITYYNKRLPSEQLQELTI